MSKMRCNISHLAQDLAPGLSRADYFRCSLESSKKTKLQSLSIIASAYVGSHPCRILQAFPVNQLPEGYQRDTSSSSWTQEHVYDNGVRFDFQTTSAKGTPTLELYIKVDATHSEPVEIRFECQFRLAVDSLYRATHPALWSLPSQLTGSLHLQPRSPQSSGPSTPREEFNRRLWRETRQSRRPSADKTASLGQVEEERIMIVDPQEQETVRWQVYSNANKMQLQMPPVLPAK